MQTTDEQVRQLIRQAEEHIDREEWDEVAELCYQVLALDPDNSTARRAGGGTMTAASVGYCE
jgi:hypothetical protein